MPGRPRASPTGVPPVSAHRATLSALALVVITGHAGALTAQGTARSSPQATAYLPVTDAAYADLDALIISGFVTEPMVGERPYSRAAIRRFVAEAERRFATVSPPARAREALTRLRARVGTPVSVSMGGARAAAGTLPAQGAPTWRQRWPRPPVRTAQ